mgnify:CR=1 FL=1
MAKSPIRRQIFFDKQVHMAVWKNSMSGKNEKKVIELFQVFGYSQGKDFVRQYPIGERFVIDIAFIKEQIAIEVDGEKHDGKKQKSLDDKRDRYLRNNNWIVLRIKDRECFGYQASYFKSLCLEIIRERRKQWESGVLYQIEIPNYKEEDYE